MINTGYKIPYLMKKPVVFPLDGIPDSDIIVDAALFRLYSDYNGRIAETLNTTDGTYSDVSLGSNDFLTPSNILSYGNDLAMSKMYSQKKTINVTQGTIANMPILAIGGTAQVNSLGMVAATKTVSTQLMTLDSHTTPADFTHITVLVKDTATSGTRDGSWVSLKYYNQFWTGNDTRQLFYTAPLKTQLNAISSYDHQAGIVSTMGSVNNGANNDFIFLTNEDKNEYTLAGNRVSTPNTAYFMRLQGGTFETYKCLCEIKLAGSQYAEIVHNRILRLFTP